MFHPLAIMGFAFLVAAVPSTVPEETEPATAETPGSTGLQVVIDPVSGRIVSEPTDAELGRLAEGVAIERRRSAWELRGFSLPTGGRGVYLDGWADHSLAVEVTADGQIRTLCSQGDRHTSTTRRHGGNER